MTEKRFTYDSKTVSILKDGEFWLDGNIDTACNHSDICGELNNLHEENQRLKKELEKSVEMLNREINSSENAFKGLMEENKQLKETIEHMQQCGAYW